MTRKYLRIAALLPLALVLCQCDRVKALFGDQPPKPTPYDFAFTIEITPAAAARLKSANDDIRVTSYFYGLASPENRAKADEMNRIGLGFQSEIYGNGARKIHIVSSELDPKNLALTVDKKANVFLTVSAFTEKGYEEKTPENMIECDGYTGPIDLAQAHPPVVHCDVWHP